MFRFDKSALAQAGLKKWWLPGILCLIAVLSGVLLPRMMPAQPPDVMPTIEVKPPPQAKAAPEAKSGPETKPPAHADKLTYAPPSLPEAPDSGAMLGRLALGTAIVLALCVATLWVGKRWLRGGPLKAGQTQKLELLDTLPVGRGASLCLVRAGSQEVLVGVDGSGIKTILALQRPFEGALEEAQEKEAAGASEQTGDAARAAA